MWLAISQSGISANTYSPGLRDEGILFCRDITQLTAHKKSLKLKPIVQSGRLRLA